MTESVFLGTGAAELYPNPFCGCDVCRRARKNHETRLRASLLLDETMMIDFGPDVAAASQHYDVPLADVEHVLVTHTHEDHFNSATFSILTMTDMVRPIHFYLSEEGFAWVHAMMELEKEETGSFGQMLCSLISQKKIVFHALKPYETYTIGTKTVTPIKTVHRGYGTGETALNYIIAWERGIWLYAADTSLYGTENLTFLNAYAQKHGALDTMIFEGTFGSNALPQNSGHMDVYQLCRQFSDLRAVSALDDHTRVYLTHINQVQHFSHAEYQQYMDIHADAHVTVAHDGMRI
ncbi:MAG: MBL fold metallo-hydrolase [Clostridia bacterium]|nr:MBL fold metallo-hydrolase [Clostridia bacterium]